MAGELALVAQLGLKNFREILSAPTDYDDGPLLRAKNAAAQTALNAQLRADENRLQQQPDNRLAKLLEIIAQEERRMAGTIGRSQIAPRAEADPEGKQHGGFPRSSTGIFY